MILVEAVGHLPVSLIVVGELLYETKESQHIYRPAYYCIFIFGIYLGPHCIGALYPYQVVGLSHILVNHGHTLHICIHLSLQKSEWIFVIGVFIYQISTHLDGGYYL